MHNTNPLVNPFPKGNQSDKKVACTGRPKAFASPEELWDKACLYFTFCQENPIPKQVFRYRKLVTVYTMREMSAKNLHAWLDVYDLRYYKKQPAFYRIVSRIYTVIDQYNYIYAAAGMLKGRSVGHLLRKSRKRRELECVRRQKAREIRMQIREEQINAIDTEKVRFTLRAKSSAVNTIAGKKIKLIRYPSKKMRLTWKNYCHWQNTRRTSFKDLTICDTSSNCIALPQYQWRGTG